MPHGPVDLNRRRVIVGSAACLAGFGVIGCGPSQPPQAARATPRADVPLRITLPGSQDDADAIARGWSSVSEQSLAIDRLDGDRTRADQMVGALLAAAKKSDVIIAPLAAVPELVAENAIVAISDEGMQAWADGFHPALRSGLTRYATEACAVPVAASLPALVSGESIEPIETWAEYDRWVQAACKGAAGEPTAAGWAAAMFLWRVAGSAERWLFAREDFEPTLGDEVYVRSLEQMAQTVARYDQPFQTPDQIWNGLNAGQLRGGIGFPAKPQQTLKSTESTKPQQNAGQWKFMDLPGRGAVAKVLLDPLLPVMTLSANCRQTEASKSFLRWISGGEGSEPTRDQIAPMSPVRVGDARAGESEYAVWLTEKLQTPLTLPAMQVLAAGEYYEALDGQVMRCLKGSTSATEALNQAASAWRTITRRVGLETQLRTWRRAQGMRA